MTTPTMTFNATDLARLLANVAWATNRKAVPPIPGRVVHLTVVGSALQATATDRLVLARDEATCAYLVGVPEGERLLPVTEVPRILKALPALGPVELTWGESELTITGATGSTRVACPVGERYPNVASILNRATGYAVETVRVDPALLARFAAVNKGDKGRRMDLLFSGEAAGSAVRWTAGQGVPTVIVRIGHTFVGAIAQMRASA